MFGSAAGLLGKPNRSQAWPSLHRDEQNPSCWKRDVTSLGLMSSKFKGNGNVNQPHSLKKIKKNPTKGCENVNPEVTAICKVDQKIMKMYFVILVSS